MASTATGANVIIVLDPERISNSKGNFIALEFSAKHLTNTLSLEAGKGNTRRVGKVACSIH